MKAEKNVTVKRMISSMRMITTRTSLLHLYRFLNYRPHSTDAITATTSLPEPQFPLVHRLSIRNSLISLRQLSAIRILPRHLINILDSPFIIGRLIPIQIQETIPDFDLNNQIDSRRLPLRALEASKRLSILLERLLQKRLMAYSTNGRVWKRNDWMKMAEKKSIGNDGVLTSVNVNGYDLHSSRRMSERTLIIVLVNRQLFGKIIQQTEMRGPIFPTSMPDQELTDGERMESLEYQIITVKCVSPSGFGMESIR